MRLGGEVERGAYSHPGRWASGAVGGHSPRADLTGNSSLPWFETTARSKMLASMRTSLEPAAWAATERASRHCRRAAGGAGMGRSTNMCPSGYSLLTPGTTDWLFGSQQLSHSKLAAVQQILVACCSNVLHTTPTCTCTNCYSTIDLHLHTFIPVF